MIEKLKQLSFLVSPAELVRKIRAEANNYTGQSDESLRQKCRNLQFEAKAGATLNELLVPSFGLACATIERVTNLRPFPTQIRAGIQLCRPCIVEMATGEGKSLTALMPVFLKSLDRKGLFFATSNDYLARRDAEYSSEVFARLGISVGCVQTESTDDERRQAYQSDITYGTTSQFGFDFLRDRAKARFTDVQGPSLNAVPVSRGTLNAIIVDEADGLMIDEAATPMVISSSPKPLPDFKSQLFIWAHQTATEAIQVQHFKKDALKEKVELTDVGRSWVRQMARNLRVERTSLLDLFDYVERAILIHNDYSRDKKYIIQDGRVIIVDENTGRLGIGREWSGGIQQAIQAKEGLDITGQAGHLAKVSVQNFVRSFKHLSGMTGTAIQSAREFKKIYKLKVKPIPTYRKCLRVEYPTLAFPKHSDAVAAMANEVRALSAQKRPVLIGTRTIKISEQISDAFSRLNIEHTLLNAKKDESEADIISHAGEAGKVTIATNMAGRGTDIKLDESAKAAGGLHVVVFGIHNSPRIDRQLIGRSARQGDPGSYRIVLFLDDDLLEFAWGPVLSEKARSEQLRFFSNQSCSKLFRRAQKTISFRMESNRAAMLHQEKKSVKQLSHAGLDPVLELPAG